MNPTVTVAPMVLAAENLKNATTEHSFAPPTQRQTAPQQEDIFTIFPNPATESATLRLPASKEGEAFILTITDMYGTIVTQQEIRTREVVMNTRLLPSGVYVCSARLGNHTVSALLHVIK